MKSIFSTPGRVTPSPQPAIQQAPTMAPTAPSMGTPNTPKAPVANNWQRGVRGMDRVKAPGVNSYAPQKPAEPFNGVQSLSRPAQHSGPPTWNGKPVQTGSYQPPAWKQQTQPVAPPPVAPPVTAGTQTGISPAVQAEIDRVRGFLGPQWMPDAAWIQKVSAELDNPLATALGNYNTGG